MSSKIQVSHHQSVVQPVAKLVCHYVTTGRLTPNFANHETMVEHDFRIKTTTGLQLEQVMSFR